MNVCCIAGNLGRDAEIRTTKSGTTVLTFSVAVNTPERMNGEWQDHTNWVTCVLFGTYAERIANRLTKGTKVAVQGRLRYSEFESQGARRNKLELYADNVELLTPRDTQETQGGIPLADTNNEW